MMDYISNSRLLDKDFSPNVQNFINTVSVATTCPQRKDTTVTYRTQLWEGMTFVLQCYRVE